MLYRVRYSNDEKFQMEGKIHCSYAQQCECRSSRTTLDIESFDTTSKRRMPHGLGVYDASSGINPCDIHIFEDGSYISMPKFILDSSHLHCAYKQRMVTSLQNISSLRYPTQYSTLTCFRIALAIIMETPSSPNQQGSEGHFTP